MRLLIALVFALASSAASAQFMSLLKGGPAELFDETDLQLFRDAARKALAEGAERQTLAWENPKTGHRGDLTVLRSFESKGRACKEVRVRNEAQTRKSDLNHNVCSVDGMWRLVGPSQL